MNKLFLDFYMN